MEPGVPLSFRERQVTALVCDAKLNKEIGFELHLTEGTVKEYLNRIFNKVFGSSSSGARNRTALAIWALSHKEAVELKVRVVEPHLIDRN